MFYSSYTNCTMVFWHVNKGKYILTNDGGFEVHEHRSGYMLTGVRFSYLGLLRMRTSILNPFSHA